MTFGSVAGVYGISGSFGVHFGFLRRCRHL